MVYAFERCELDEARLELRCDGALVEVQPKVLDLLLYLLRHRDRVVAKDELLDALWPGAAVTESALTRAVSEARSAIGDRRRSAIRTHARQGYRFEAAVHERGGAPPAGSAATPGAATTDIFVGREAALATLRGALDEALAGRGALVLLTGVPGIGKTSTAEHVAAEAAGRGARVVGARCHEAAGAPAFWPWVQVLRALVEERDPEALAPEERPAWQLVAGAEARGPALPSEGERFRVFEAVGRLLARQARARPVVLLLDDLHWADPPSLLLLRHLAADLGRSAVLALGTVRDGEPDPGGAMAALQSEAARQPGPGRIALEGFSEPEVAGFLAAVRGEPAPEGLVHELLVRTEGNPLFIREVVRLLAAEGHLALRELASNWSLSVPRTVRDVIARRLARLSADCQEMLQAAAVIGREFPLTTLTDASDWEPEAIRAALDEAAAARLVAEQPRRPGTFSFEHALVREALYDGTPAGARAQWHRRVGEALETRHAAAPDPVLSELAHHFHAATPAGTEERAIDYAVRAAQRATRLHAHEDAALLYERALDALELRVPLDEPRRLELLLALGDARLLAAEVEAARAAFLRAATAARSLDAAPAFVHAAQGYGASTLWGVPPDETQRELIDEALALQPAAAPRQRARLLSLLCVSPSANDDGERSDALSHEAIALARALGDPAVLSEALHARHFLLRGPDHLDERESLAAEILELAQEIGSAERAYAIPETAAADRLVRGDLVGYREMLAVAEAQAERERHPAFQWLHLATRASVALLRGRLDEAEVLIPRALDAGQRLRAAQALPLFLGQLFLLRREQGRIAEVSGLFESADLLRADLARAFAAAARAELDDREGARRALDALAGDDFRALPRQDSWLATLCEAARVAAWLGDRPRSEALEALLAPYAACHAVVPGALLYLGPVSRALAHLAHARGERDEAAGHFEVALAESARVGALPVHLRVCREYEACLRESRDPAQRQRARAIGERVRHLAGPA
ncbi:MAG: AAA family ATPase [Myxococcota bacterium]|nr:AAA family ATPase [Myxococcota bacterium]